MSTRAQIAVQIRTDEWAHTYVHFDGYPSHMLPALAHWTPEEILAAKEIRQVTVEGLDSFDAPRAPIVYPEPRCDFCHTYVFAQGGWIEWKAGK
jgi:hypothetical protein